MPNYQNAKIYKIMSSQTDKIYIGSTVQKLCVRMASHRANKTTELEEILKFNDAKICLIENYPCETKEELTKRQQMYVKKFSNICINDTSHIPHELNDNNSIYNCQDFEIKLINGDYYLTMFVKDNNIPRVIMNTTQVQQQPILQAV